MSNTFKVKAAWYAHHTIPEENSVRKRSAKQKVCSKDVPPYLHDLVETIDQKWVATRSGNPRKAEASAKKRLRQADRVSDKRALQAQLRDIY